MSNCPPIWDICEFYLFNCLKKKERKKKKIVMAAEKKRESMKYKQETSFNEELKKNIYKISCEKEKKKKKSGVFLYFEVNHKDKISFIYFI